MLILCGKDCVLDNFMHEQHKTMYNQSKSYDIYIYRYILVHDGEIFSPRSSNSGFIQKETKH